MPELLEQVRQGKIPMTAKVQVTLDEQASPRTPEPGETSDEPKDPTLALFEQWEREDALMSEEEIEAERHLFEQFEKNVNETRRALGMRTL